MNQAFWGKNFGIPDDAVGMSLLQQFGAISSRSSFADVARTALNQPHMAVSHLHISQSLAFDLYGKDTRRNGELSFLHADRIAKYAAKINDPELVQIAYLHDLVEEKRISLAELKSYEFSSRVIDAVDALTKQTESGEGYLNYIERLAQNQDAIIIKLLDIRDNSSQGAKEDRLEFLYPIAKAYLVDARRRHQSGQPLIAIGDFMDQSQRVQKLKLADPDQFQLRQNQYLVTPTI